MKWIFFFVQRYSDALIVHDLHWKALQHYVFLQQLLIKNLSCVSNDIFLLVNFNAETLCGALISTQVALSQIICSHFALTTDDVIFLTTSFSTIN